MERVRQKKSKVPTINEGSRHTQRQSSVPKLASDSSSYSASTTKDDLFTCDWGRSSSRRVTGTPIKKLLAEEMSKETESKRRPSSVIARLMGLDGLPPQQTLHRQDKGFLETYRQKTASVGSQSNGKQYERRLNRKNSMEQQEFKDVYEVMETSKVDRGNPAKWTVNPKLSEAEMAFIRQKFMDVKRLSTDEKLHNSKEFCDMLDMLDTNKDLLMKFLQQPDSLFTKHLLDLQGAAPRSQCSRIAIIKPSNLEKYESNIIGWKSEKETLRCDTSSHRKYHDGVSTHPVNHRGARKPLNSSKIQLEGKHETDILPTRIVVLKPNLEKVRNATKSVSSPCSSHGYLSDCRKQMEYPSIGTGEAGPGVKKKLSSDAGFLRPKSRESREIAKAITRRMREGFGNELIDLPSIFWGYAGDESSYNVSGSDSASESEVTMLTSRKSFHFNRRKPSSSHSFESSVSKEAKKRLSERWKMSQRYEDVGAVGKASTLGEMLACPGRESRTENLNLMIGLDGSSDRFAGNDKIEEWNSPLGISSRDGWKDGCCSNSSRLRSIPASSVGYGGPKTSMQCEIPDQNSYLMAGEAMKQGRNKSNKGNFNKKEVPSSRNLRSSNKKYQSPCHIYSDSTDSLDEKQFNESQLETLLEKDPSELKSLVPEVPANNFNSTSLIADAKVAAEHEDMTMSAQSLDELPQNPSPCFLGNDISSTPGPEDSKSQEPQIGPSEDSIPLQCPIPEPQSPASSKEAEHLSPVSVLEAPFTEDVSSGSECFERVSADLHELRMQLKLLKMESGAYADGGMLLSSDKDVGQGSVTDSEEKAIIEDDSWESSYLVDVLIDSGFDDNANLDMIMAIWHSSECPVGPWVFDNLEKKYCTETSWLRSERRLLFDRINSGLVEIYQWLVDPHPWVKLLTRNVGLKWQKPGVKHELQKFLEREKKEIEDKAATVLDREMQWLDFGDEIDVIGTELEKLLIEDLIAEVTNM